MGDGWRGLINVPQPLRPKFYKIKRSLNAAKFTDYFFFPLSYFTSSNPKKVAKKYFDDCPIRVRGTPEQIQVCWLLAPDLSLALALRGADAMWTVLFSVTFVIAVALQLAVLSQVDFD